MIKKKWLKKISGYFNLSRVAEKSVRIPIVIHHDFVEAARKQKQKGTTKGLESQKYYLAATAIIKNEGPYLAEWLEFHKLRGIEKFVLYDNGSTDCSKEVLLPYQRAGFVDLIPWKNFLQGANHQHLAYAHACVNMASQAKWLAVIDADEFLFSPQISDVREILRGMEKYPSVGVFLRCFGPSGHNLRPPGLVIENYSFRLNDENWQNRQYKSIVQPALMRSVISAQRFHNINNNTPAFDEDGLPLLHSTDHPHKSMRLRINHYAAKSLEELEAKIQRPYFWDPVKRDKRKNEKSKQHSVLIDAPIQDHFIMKFLPELKAVMVEASVKNPFER